MIQQRLEHGEVAEILVAETVLELADLVRDISLPLESFHDCAADFPVEILDLGLVRQIHHAQREHVLRVIATFLRVVIRFKLVQLGEVLLDVEQLAHDGLLVVTVGEVDVWMRLADRAKDFHHEHTVMRDDGASALADDVGVRNFLLIANIRDVINDVVRIFLERVIRRAVERRPAAVVIHAQPAAHVQKFDVETHLADLAVEPRRFLHRFLYRENIRDLRADVEMDQLETMPKVLRLQQFRRRENLRRAQSELRVLAAALRPFARALAQQPRADADEWFNTELFGHGNDLPQLLEFLHDHDDLLAELGAEQCHLDELSVLVAVADDEAAHLVLERESCEEFRLAADFEAEIKLLPSIQDFFHHFTKLVYLDREHAAILALIIELRDRAAERAIDGLHAMTKNVLEADEQRKFQPAPARFLDHIGDLHRSARVLERRGDDFARVVDVEIFRSPAMDVVEVARCVGVPVRRRVGRIAHLISFKPDAL